GDSVIPGVGTMLSELTGKTGKALLSTLGLAGIPVTSGSSSEAASKTNTRFAEVHVYSFPFSVNTAAFIPCASLSSITLPFPTIHYISELDSIEWRLGIFEALHPKSLLAASLGPICSVVSPITPGLCMGYWGPLYPRRGYFIHGSEVVASASLSYRAVSISSLEGFFGHVVLMPLVWSPSERDKLQLLYPLPSGCIKIGQNPATWEFAKTSFTGKYVWVYWRHRECCLW
ncbi:MAG: TraU family protein, partial [Candidatus Omnitrophica bacterium]|nr:TraU family protein [Candidatus Omnitrophota bacterium]